MMLETFMLINGDVNVCATATLHDSKVNISTHQPQNFHKRVNMEER
jgi:hypothetical protein